MSEYLKPVMKGGEIKGYACSISNTFWPAKRLARAEKYVAELLAAIGPGTLTELRNRYRDYDKQQRREKEIARQKKYAPGYKPILPPELEDKPCQQ